MKLFVTLGFWAYVAMFLFAGAGGIAAAQREPQLMFDLDLSQLPDSGRASLLNQYRFLRAVELGFGLFCLLYRKEIFSTRKGSLVFVLTLLAIPLARTLSIVFDGWPAASFLAFMSAEYVLFGLFAVHFYRSLWRKQVAA